MTWEDYEKTFLALMAERRVDSEISQDLFQGRVVLLCSESTPDKCHRRLVVEYLNDAWGNTQGVQL